MIYAVNKRTKEHVAFRSTGELPNGRWRFVEADADGWIPWPGGERSLPDGARYNTQHKSGFFVAGNHPEILKEHWAGRLDPIVKYRPILESQPSEWRGPQDGPPKWNGKGLPPVGTVCEGYVQDSDKTWRWLEVEILKQHNIPQNECAVHVTNRAILRWCDQFRPIRTDRERWIQAAEPLLRVGNTETVLGKIYDALKSGELPQP